MKLLKPPTTHYIAGNAMAKQKNRDKRKTLKSRKKNQQVATMQNEQNIYPLVFRGYMMTSLDPSLPPEELRSKSTYTEDWVTQRLRIFSKNRRYRVTAHVFRNGIMGEAVATGYLPSRVSEREIPRMAVESFASAREKFTDIDMSQVYICIRA